MLYHFFSLCFIRLTSDCGWQRHDEGVNYLQETFFNMALLIIMIFGANSVVKEMFGL